MPDWLVHDLSSDVTISAGDLASRLVLALAFGGCVAVAYCLSHGRYRGDKKTLATTLVLLSVLIAMVSLVIGNSVARAFGLVGALSIVRFRTVVEDTRDTAFVIFAVIVGMAVGAGLPLVAVVGIPIVGLAAVGLSFIGGGEEATLTVRLGLGRDAEALLADVLSRHVVRRRMVASGTARQGTALELTYAVQFKAGHSMSGFVGDLNQIEGVQGVELRRM